MTRRVDRVPIDRDLLEDLLGFLDDHLDVVDGPDGQPRPNRAMGLHTLLEAAMAQPDGRRRFQVVSPDGLPIAPRPHRTRAEAELALQVWAARFTPQGYYAAADGRRIPVWELIDACRIEEVS